MSRLRSLLSPARPLPEETEGETTRRLLLTAPGPLGEDEAPSAYVPFSEGVSLTPPPAALPDLPAPLRRVRELLRELGVTGDRPISEAREAKLIRVMMERARTGVVVGALLILGMAGLVWQSSPSSMRPWILAWLAVAATSVLGRAKTVYHWNARKIAQRSDAEVKAFIYAHRWAWTYNAFAWGLSAALFYGRIPTEAQFICWTVVAGAAQWASAGAAFCRPIQRQYTHSLFVTLFTCIALLDAFGTARYFNLGAAFLILPIGHWFLIIWSTRAALNSELNSMNLMDELEAARMQAVNAMRMKNRLLAATAHDIRQPVHAMKLFTGNVKASRTMDEVMEAAEKLERCADAVHNLFDTLFDLSSIDTGTSGFNVEDVDVVELVGTLVDRFDGQAEAKDIRMTSFGSPERRIARSDKQALERLLSNLITNAIKYTAPGGRVLVAVRNNSRGLAVEVWDTGVGIPASEVKNVFQEFFKLNSSLSGNAEGFGLGLSIVQRLSRLLNHPVVLTSRQGEKHGSRFRVVLRDANQADLNEEMERNKREHAAATAAEVIAQPTLRVSEPPTALGALPA